MKKAHKITFFSYVTKNKNIKNIETIKNCLFEEDGDFIIIKHKNTTIRKKSHNVIEIDSVEKRKTIREHKRMMKEIKDMMKHKKYVVSDFFDKNRDRYFLRESGFDSKLIKITDKCDSEIFKEKITKKEILCILEKQVDVRIKRFLNNLIRNDKYIRLNTSLCIKEI